MKVRRSKEMIEHRERDIHIHRLIYCFKGGGGKGGGNLLQFASTPGAAKMSCF